MWPGEADVRARRGRFSSAAHARRQRFVTGRRALRFAAAAAGLVASMISAPLAAFASEDAARLALGLSSNCPLCNSFSPFLFSTTKRNFSPPFRISILPAINVLLIVIGIRVYVPQRRDVRAGRG